MGMLFLYEMKKLFARRAAWLFIVLGIVLGATGEITAIRRALGGYADGFRDAYARYEGQIATDALLARAEADYRAYIAAHPGEFLEQEIDNEGAVETIYGIRVYNSYAGGLFEAYNKITRHETVESRRNMAQRLRRDLETGYYSNGKALTERQKADETETLERLENNGPPVIRCPGDWERLLLGPGSPAALLLLLAALAPVYSGEHAARMAAIALASPRRKGAAAAKLLAAECWALLAYLTGYGPRLLSAALACGLPNPSMPVSAAMNHFTDFNMPVWQALLWTGSIHLGAALSCAALTVFCSSVSCRPFVSLLWAGGVIFVQILLYSFVNEFDIFVIWGSYVRSGVSPFEILPANILYRGYNPVASPGQTSDILPVMLLSLVPAAVLAAASPRCWLRRRKA